MAVFEVVSGGDRRSLILRFERKSKQQAISELVDFHLLSCARIDKLELELAKYEPDIAAWRDVVAERRRQVESKGFDAGHDDMATQGQIARAASCYALHASGIGTDWPDGIRNGSALFWPWDREWWKPKSARENLVRAAALILAEIERLDRAAAPAQGGRDE